MSEIIFYIVTYIATIIYITKLLMLDHQHFFRDPNHTFIIETPDGDIYRTYDILDSFRSRLLNYKTEGFVTQVPYSTQTHLLLCPYCLSFWVNLILLPLLIIFLSLSLGQSLLLIFSVPLITGYFLNER